MWMCWHSKLLICGHMNSNLEKISHSSTISVVVVITSQLSFIAMDGLIKIVLTAKRFSKAFLSLSFSAPRSHFDPFNPSAIWSARKFPIMHIKCIRGNFENFEYIPAFCFEFCTFYIFHARENSTLEDKFSLLNSNENDARKLVCLVCANSCDGTNVCNGWKHLYSHCIQ